VEAYRAKHIVQDLAVFADHLSPGRPFILAGHDWGASIAYAYAFAHPERLTHLIVANGVHPVLFQRAILDDPEQRNASQYINFFRQPDAEAWLSENDFAGMFQMLAAFSDTSWMRKAQHSAYIEAWSRRAPCGRCRLVLRLAAGRARTRRERRPGADPGVAGRYARRRHAASGRLGRR
jgi:pimeloyl-ACP methyl ester carboxylesterase